MAKRKKSKAKRVSSAAKAGLSTRSYNLLKKEAGNARRRINNFLKRSDAYEYFVPSQESYTLANLLERVGAGESVKSLLKEVRAITAEKITTSTSTPVVSKLGYKLKQSEAKAIRDAVTKANKNIREAREKFDIAVDILPELKSSDKIIAQAVNSTSIKNQLDILNQYTPENLIPIAINESGEAGTQAELYETTKILELENERRKRLRDQTEKQIVHGYLVDQNQYESRDIDIESIETIKDMRRMAGTWSDYGAVVRANIYLQNYSDSLELLTASLINIGMYNETVGDMIKFIHKTISKLYNNEEAISFISRYVPEVSIAIVSPPAGERESVASSMDFKEIYDAWTGIKELFL